MGATPGDGLLILFYLLLHLFVIGQAAVSPQSFDAIMQTLSGPFWRVLEVGLLACVLYHGINGIRIILLDLGYGIRVQRTWCMPPWRWSLCCSS